MSLSITFLSFNRRRIKIEMQEEQRKQEEIFRIREQQLKGNYLILLYVKLPSKTEIEILDILALTLPLDHNSENNVIFVNV